MTHNAATGPETHVELSLDVRRALESCAAQLESEFADSVDAETVRRLVYESYETLTAHAAIEDFLPLLAERFARQQLHARARVSSESHSEMLVVLFLCNHNAGRSQMALGYFNHFAGGGAVAWSGGSEPQGEINPAAIAVMAERGIDISGEFPKPWTGETPPSSGRDRHHGLWGARTCRPEPSIEDWALDDPAGKDCPTCD